VNGGDLHGMTYHCHCLTEFVSEKLASEVKPFPRMGLLILICYILSHSHSVEKIQESSNSDTNNRYFT